MKLYIYNPETKLHLATITGNSNADCESVMAANFDPDKIGATYSPAFGANDGLEENQDAQEIKA